MRSFCEILLDGESILPMVRSLRLDRRNDQAVDELTLELASYALYDEFDFSTLPAALRLQVATAVADPKASRYRRPRRPGPDRRCCRGKSA